MVVTGGRYDALMGKFGRSAPATGFAVDVAGVAGALPVQEVKTAHKLVHYEAGCLGAAMKLQCSDGAGEIELSCCETRKSRRLAHQKGFPHWLCLPLPACRKNPSERGRIMHRLQIALTKRAAPGQIGRAV